MSELIKDLQIFIEEFGDLEVITEAREESPMLEFNNDDQDEDPVIIIS